MLNVSQFQLETNGNSATLYISEEIPNEHLDGLRDACVALPAQVRTLRLDLHGVRRIGVEMMASLRVLMREWRLTRGGECRLSFSTENLVLTYTERAMAAVQTPWTVNPVASDAMTAAYL